MNKRDKRIFQKILKYCGQVIWTHDFFHVDKTLFFNEQDGIAYRNAIAMPILQIGELAKLLTSELRDANPDIPWREIIRMRDVAAHHYDSWNYDDAWDTSRDDVPALAEKIRHIMEMDPGNAAES